MAVNQTEPTSSATNEIIEVRIERLFLRLSAIYGYLWWNIYQNQELLRITKIEWSTCLKRFDNQVLKEALLSCREKKGYPPALPEFMDCCKAIQKRRDPCVVVEEPYVPCNEAIALKNIQEMYDALKK
jgi:hypothetical protein